MSYFIGSTPEQVANGFIKRYFYGLRRNQDGELYLIRIDQLQGGDQNIVVINDLGIEEENFPDFEEGIDFFEGVDTDGNVLYPNLRYPQFKWDGRSLEYFIESETGFFVQKVSEGHEYEADISTPGYGEVPDNEVIK
jgi:hypothetical protein